MARRRRRSYEKKKPVALTSVVTLLVGIICFVTAVILIIISTGEMGFGKLVGAVGFMTMIISMMAFAIGVRTAREVEKDAVTRLLGVVAPAVSMVVLLIFYFTGILFG